MLPRQNDKGAVLRQMAFAAPDRLFVKLGNVPVPMNRFEIAEALGFEAVR